VYNTYILNKPYGILSQFTAEGKNPGLSSILRGLSSSVYPIGRLDLDSEGLLLLTDDKQLHHRLLNPASKHTRSYWVQIEGEITDQALNQLMRGIDLYIEGRQIQTLPAQAKRISPPTLPPRNPPIRVRKSIPDSWIELTLTEGKNRQVRRMTAAVGYPTLRLIRSKIGHLELGDLKAGEWKACTKSDLVLVLAK
jgi:23S rRNA pseudouridine2457 synthase